MGQFFSQCETLKGGATGHRKSSTTFLAHSRGVKGHLFIEVVHQESVHRWVLG